MSSTLSGKMSRDNKIVAEAGQVKLPRTFSSSSLKCLTSVFVILVSVLIVLPSWTDSISVSSVLGDDRNLWNSDNAYSAKWSVGGHFIYLRNGETLAEIYLERIN